MHPLIAIEELDAITDDVVLCDIRWDLTDPTKGRATYEKGHIPGAVFVDLDADLSGTPGDAGRHPLPQPDAFAVTLSSLGIDPDTHVVVYDDIAGRIAARMWWMMRAVGHEKVQVLDGGYQAWVDAGKDIGVGTVTATLAHYPVPEGFTGVVDHTELAERVVVDARSAERYRGEIEPVDPKAGHIPGALNIPTDANLATDGRFLLGTDLEDVYAEVPDRAIVSCGSGVTACHVALAMLLAGRPMPDVYVGSFSEWSRLDLPVATGPNP
jgi:thiosulfate/3-mercaptopyruvate sulfurtransferase